MRPDADGAAMEYGALAGDIDKQAGAFITEKDLLVWLVFNNVTVCDLASPRYLYKGRVEQRPGLAEAEMPEQCHVL